MPCVGWSSCSWHWILAAGAPVFYLLHIPLIHGLAGLWKTFEGPEISVSLCYLIWLLVMLILYFPCRWFAEVKTQAKGGWTSYF